jgi:cytidylate kinase
MIVTIDGPAGAGKSTVTRLLAQRLGFDFLDTGAMYRAVTWSAMQRGFDLSDQDALVVVAKEIQLDFEDERVLIGTQDVTKEIRERNVTRNVVFVADAPQVRAHLVDLQRRIAATGDFVCEGRDQGTVAFPNAFCKIYLTASSNSRALRRVEQMQSSGQYVDFDQIVREQDVRDEQDLTRKVGKLQKAEDAVEVNTDQQSLEEVVDCLEKIVRGCLVDLQP